MSKIKYISDTLLVSVDFTHGDKGVLIVGKKRPNESVEIVNAFQGEEAWRLYEKLITLNNKSTATMDKQNRQTAVETIAGKEREKEAIE